MLAPTNCRLADAKRRIQVGTVLVLESHPFWKEMEGVARPVSIVQTGKFALKTTKPRTGEIVDSWIDWPKAADFSYDCVAGRLNIEGMIYRIEA